MSDWPPSDAPAVYDPARVTKGPDPRDSDYAGVPAAVLEERERLHQAHARALGDQGVYVFGQTASGAVRYYALDQQRAEALISERYGADTEFSYQGAERRALRPHPFGSWRADDRALTVFYGLPHNGERYGGCIVAEEEGYVVVALMIVDWLGFKTLVGGFKPSHVTVTLESELGDRVVVDNFDNRARPHWTAVADVPRRPQDM